MNSNELPNTFASTKRASSDYRIRRSQYAYLNVLLDIVDRFQNQVLRQRQVTTKTPIVGCFIKLVTVMMTIKVTVERFTQRVDGHC